MNNEQYQGLEIDRDIVQTQPGIATQNPHQVPPNSNLPDSEDKIEVDILTHTLTNEQNKREITVCRKMRHHSNELITPNDVKIEDPAIKSSHTNLANENSCNKPNRPLVTSLITSYFKYRTPDQRKEAGESQEEVQRTQGVQGPVPGSVVKGNISDVSTNDNQVRLAHLTSQTNEQQMQPNQANERQMDKVKSANDDDEKQDKTATEDMKSQTNENDESANHEKSNIRKKNSSIKKEASIETNEKDG